MRFRSIIFSILCVANIFCVAQDDYEAFKKRQNSSFENFKKRVNEDYENFRKKANEEYAALLERAWEKYNSIAKISVPEDDVKPVAPINYPKDDKDEPAPTPKPIPYEEVVPVPVVTPQPEPISPIEEVIDPVAPVTPTITFSFFGTEAQVRFTKPSTTLLKNVDEKSISAAWKNMSTDNYTNLVYDCLKIRSDKQLCDWAYLEMLKSLSEHIFGKGSNDATLLMAYVYCQSGYKMRLARGNDNKLYMMYASDHIIYNKDYFSLDNTNFYTYGEAPNQMYVCNVSFPQEKSMSLYINRELKLANKTTSPRTIQSKGYPEIITTITPNLNLLDFYETYPTSMIGSNMVSRWAMYANTPLDENVKKQIYPSLQAAIKGCDQLTAVNKLLNYVQTGFVYEYDSKVWGCDRAFFAEETLYYPYSDCEDRSILFTRLVRDLLGLRCILIYYPGHLASAVEFTETDVKGDYILLNNSKFIVSDPTYINAPVGRTMPKMDNATAQVIMLQ